MGTDPHRTARSFFTLCYPAPVVPPAARQGGAPDTTAPWWTWPCNTPPQQWPDGCDEFTPIEQPDSPLPPPCIRAATLITVTNDDQPVYIDLILRIVVDHPEYTNGISQTVDVRHPRHGYNGPEGSSLLPPTAWETDVGDWSYKCARDEAPLAWAVVEILNARSFGPAGLAYNRALPWTFLELLAGVGQIPLHRLYLPLVVR